MRIQFVNVGKENGTPIETIRCIKALRQIGSLGLAEAKGIVDDIRFRYGSSYIVDVLCDDSTLAENVKTMWEQGFKCYVLDPMSTNTMLFPPTLRDTLKQAVEAAVREHNWEAVVTLASMLNEASK